MRLTVLGSGAACPPPGQNGSGYLVEDQGLSLLVDCGQGVASALQMVQPGFRLDHILVTHMHPDHFVDLIPLRFLACRDLSGLPKPHATVHLPTGGLERLQTLLQAFSFPADFFATVFHLREYDPDRPLAFGPLTVRFAPATHYILAFGIRIDGSGSVAFSGDSGPSSAVAHLARGTDVFVCEATLQQPEKGPRPGHCTPLQAAEMARTARTKRLVLSHFWYGTDLQRAVDEATKAFAGPIDAASDGLEIEFERDPEPSPR